jgi:hypothetical protein
MGDTNSGEQFACVQVDPHLAASFKLSLISHDWRHSIKFRLTWWIESRSLHQRNFARPKHWNLPDGRWVEGHGVLLRTTGDYGSSKDSVLDVSTSTHPCDPVIDSQGECTTNSHALNPTFLRQQLERSVNGRQAGMDEFSHGRSADNYNPTTTRLHTFDQG